MPIIDGVGAASNIKQKLNSIRYKDFVFPYNPETTSFKCDRSYIKHKYPNLAGNELEDFGINAVVITGHGCFFGEQAYNEFHDLFKEFEKEGVGDFSHPIYTEVTRGLMVNLESTVDPEVNTIRYSFEIVADTEPNVAENIGSYVTAVETNNKSNNASYKVGDIVDFHGGMHYVSSYSSAKGYSASAGKAKITLGPDCKGNGGAHPWHLVHTDSKSNVYGWVDEGTFTHTGTSVPSTKLDNNKTPIQWANDMAGRPVIN